MSLLVTVTSSASAVGVSPPPPPQACVGLGLGCFEPPTPDRCATFAVPSAIKACESAATARGAVFTVAGSAPGAAESGYETARNLTLNTVDGANGTLVTTYDGIVGAPNETLAQIVVGAVAPNAGTLDIATNGSAVVLDSANVVVDTITPPVISDGNDTIDTTLVANGDQLDAVLEHPLPAGAVASVSIPVRAYPGGTTGSEFGYCLRHHSQCSAVKKLANQALASASRRFPPTTRLSRSPWNFAVAVR